MKVKDVKDFFKGLDDELEVGILGYGGQGGWEQLQKIEFIIKETKTYEGKPIKVVAIELKGGF